MMTFKSNMDVNDDDCIASVMVKDGDVVVVVVVKKRKEKEKPYSFLSPLV